MSGTALDPGTDELAGPEREVADVAASRDLVRKYADAFDAVGTGALARERERRQPHAAISLLRTVGFTRTTLPVELGGDGATHAELFELLAELARRDPNVAQALRPHFNFIDRLRHLPDSAAGVRERHLRRIAEGSVQGNATFERSGAAIGEQVTAVTADEDGLRLDGRKFYSTGTLTADHVGVLAVRDGAPVSVVIPTDSPGVTRIDDWAGFGQRLTGSGTTVFENVRITEGDLIERDAERPTHSSAFAQLVLVAVITGIGRAVVDDAAGYVRSRTRHFSHAAGETAQRDPLVQEVVGELAAKSFAADGALALAAAAIGRSSAAIRSDAPEDVQRGLVAEAERATALAQLVAIQNVLPAATDLFEVGGASATDESRALDRHWRNARTVASHNPSRYKARGVGDLLINGTPLVGWWTGGEAKGSAVE
ncbi:MAG: acyl-CoA dehydrogenase family protein [Microbacteriaceae bacterium]|nr:acyl-CoA dehydrogenase family protein [Microbacteriaceae bacterium]